MNDPNFAALDAVPRVLAAALSSTATSLTIESGYASLPAIPFEIKVGDEIIAVGARSGNVLSALTRGSAGTSAAPHNKWDAVAYGVSSTTLAAGGGGGGGSVPFVGIDAPSSPTDGMLWWDPDDNTPVGGSSSFLVATATVTSSQLLNLTTVPAELVAAPGAGKMLVGLDFIIQVSAGTPYDDTGQQVEIALDPGDVDVTLVPNTDFAGFFGVVDRIWIPPTDYSFGIQPPADVVNKPIGMVNFGTELSGGDTELTVTTYYAELTVT